MANLVQAPTIDTAPLSAALASADPVTRGTAARVTLVRGLTALLPKVREVLAKETNAEAAREEVRALALLGSDDDVAFTVKQLPRFPSEIDLDFCEAIARRGAPQATMLYIRHRGELRLVSPYVRHALWRRGSLATPTASRLLGANDTAGFSALLSAVLESAIDLDPGILAAASGSQSAQVRSDTVWYLIQRYAVETDKVPESAGHARDGMTVDEAFGREVLRRMRGAEVMEKPEWLAWLATSEGRGRVPGGKPVLRHLSLNEQNALSGEKSGLPYIDIRAASGQTVPPAPFIMAISLPPHLGAQLLKRSGCSGSWVGSAAVTVDRAGRVQSVGTGQVLTNADCHAALQTMLRLTLADPRSLVAPMASSAVQLVASREQRCLDEDAVLNGGQPEPLRVRGEIKAPTIVRRIEPDFPEEARLAMSGSSLVVAEALISRTGCIRDIHVLHQSDRPQLNTAAVIALSKWKFKPATLDGQPVDVIFNLTVHFKLR